MAHTNQDKNQSGEAQTQALVSHEYIILNSPADFTKIRGGEAVKLWPSSGARRIGSVAAAGVCRRVRGRLEAVVTHRTQSIQAYGYIIQPPPSGFCVRRLPE